MLNYLPSYLRKSKITQSIIKSEQQQLEQIDIQLEDIQKQMFIETATWAIPIYEKELKIIPSSTSSIEQRRAMIKAKWQSQSKIDKILLEAVATAILQTVVTVSFDGKINFSFNTTKKVSNFKQFHQAIEDIKPAHLPIEVIGEIKNIINLVCKTYQFQVPYDICNQFYTDTVPGKLGKGNVLFLNNQYSFNAMLPICGTFLTSTINSQTSVLNVELDNEYRNINVLYQRASNKLIAGEGEI